MLTMLHVIRVMHNHVLTAHPAPSPAWDSITTAPTPSDSSCFTLCGETATRFSPSYTSLGTPVGQLHQQGYHQQGELSYSSWCCCEAAEAVWHWHCHSALCVGCSDDEDIHSSSSTVFELTNAKSGVGSRVWLVPHNLQSSTAPSSCCSCWQSSNTAACILEMTQVLIYITLASNVHPGLFAEANHLFLLCLLLFTILMVCSSSKSTN
jgi:hypothetical protein